MLQALSQLGGRPSACLSVCLAPLHCCLWKGSRALVAGQKCKSIFGRRSLRSKHSWFETFARRSQRGALLLLHSVGALLVAFTSASPAGPEWSGRYTRGRQRNAVRATAGWCALCRCSLPPHSVEVHQHAHWMELSGLRHSGGRQVGTVRWGARRRRRRRRTRRRRCPRTRRRWAVGPLRRATRPTRRWPRRCRRQGSRGWHWGSTAAAARR
jgi:hypothetical protein